MSNTKKTKHQEAINNGFSEHTYPTYSIAKKYEEAFIKKGSNAFYSRLGSKGNYTHHVLVK